MKNIYPFSKEKSEYNKFFAMGGTFVLAKWNHLSNLGGGGGGGGSIYI